MSKYLIALFITFGLGFGTQAFAKTITLSPKSSQQLTNNYRWTLNANCNIQTNGKNKIRFSILRNTGVVNGRKLNSGQGTSFTVQTNDNVSVSAEPGTQVNISNLGTDSVQAYCT